MASNEWETEVYARGRQVNRWPFSDLVADVMRISRTAPCAVRSVLELGCGTGNNMWFLLDSGFEACGIDISPTAVTIARERLQRLGFDGLDLRVGSVAELPWERESFDIVLDRGTLSQVTLADLKRTIAEVHRVLRPGGLMFSYNVFGWNHPGRELGVEVAPRSYSGFSGGRFFAKTPLTTFLDVPLIRDVWWPLRITKLERHDVKDVASGAAEEYYTVHAIKD